MQCAVGSGMHRGFHRMLLDQLFKKGRAANTVKELGVCGFHFSCVQDKTASSLVSSEQAPGAQSIVSSLGMLRSAPFCRLLHGENLSVRTSEGTPGVFRITTNHYLSRKD